VTLQFVSDWHPGMSLPMKRSKKLKLTWGPQTNRCPKEACTIEVGFSMGSFTTFHYEFIIFIFHLVFEDLTLLKCRLARLLKKLAAGSDKTILKCELNVQLL
jgi:hypothetical protein